MADQMDWVVRVSGGGALVAWAAALGLLERRGLAVELSSSNDSQKQARALLDGGLDVASSDADNWVAWIEDQGADFFFLMVGEGTRSGGNDFHVTPEIQDWEDLRGKTIAVDSPFSGQSTVVRLMLRRHGLEVDRDCTFLSVGYSPQRAQAIREGRAVGASLSASAVAGEDGKAAGLRCFAVESDYVTTYPRAPLVTTRRFAAQHPDRLLDFMLAVVDTQEWLRDSANEAEAVAALARTDEMNEERARRTYRETVGRIGELSAAAQVREDMIQLILDLRAEVGLLGRPTPPVSKYVVPAWYELALRVRTSPPGPVP
jgi:ABC-type nitrate/sulfonate/bicarbonate transport system substrate-binding protein